MRTLPALLLASAASGCGAFAPHEPPDPKWLVPATGLLSVPIREAPADRPLRVAVLGDAQGNREAMRQVFAAIRERKPDLVVFLGDAVECYPAGNLPDFGPWKYAIPFWPQHQRGKPAVGLLSIVPFPALLHETLQAPFGPPRDPDGWNLFLEESFALRVTDAVPFLFVPGNHDLYHRADREIVARLTAAADPDRLWRWADAGRFRFFVLDAGDDLWGERSPIRDSGPQLKWLDEALSEAEQLGRIPIVCTHFPPFSSAAVEPPSPHVRHGVAERVIAKHRVPLILSGHAHAYERIEARLGERAVTAIVTGGAGGPFTELEESRREEGSKAFVSGLHHFVMLELSEAGIRGRMYPLDPGPRYVPNWHERRDEFLVPLK